MIAFLVITVIIDITSWAVLTVRYAMAPPASAAACPLAASLHRTRDRPRP